MIMENVVKIREDLHDIVKSIEFKKIKTRYNERFVAVVTLFNDEVVEFKDTQGLYDLFIAYRKTGYGDFIKSKTLVEEFYTSSADITEIASEEKNTGTYICVLFELSDDTKYRLFPARKYTDRKIIDLYYNLFKKKQKEQQAQTKQNQNK